MRRVVVDGYHVVLQKADHLTAGQICREHQLSPQVFSRWKAEFVERAPEIFATKPSRGDALQQIGRFLDDVYAHKRIHSSLGYLTPAEFEMQWRREQMTAHNYELKSPEKLSNPRGPPHK